MGSRVVTPPVYTVTAVTGPWHNRTNFPAGSRLLNSRPVASDL